MSISNYVRRTGSEDREDINRLLGLISDIFYPEPEEGSVQERIALTGTQKRKRTETIASGVPDVEPSESHDRHCGEGVGDVSPTWQVPSSCQSYPLIHATTGTFTFHDASTSDTKESKFGAFAQTDGSSYITITDHTNLDITDALTLDIWYYHKSTGSLQTILEKNGAYKIEISATTNVLTAEFSINSVAETVTFTLPTENLWYHIVAIWDNSSNLLELYTDGTQRDTEATSGNMDTSASDLVIFADSAGANISSNGTRFAWFFLINEKMDSTYITNSKAGHHDISGGNLVTSIHCLGDVEAMAEAFTPFCVSS